MSLVKTQEQTALQAIGTDFALSNAMQAPRIEKVVVSVGIGSVKDKHKIEVIQDRLARITGQKPAACAAKKSIASFKVREGDTVGYRVTMRGARAYAFLDKVIHVALPRTKDFRGIVRTAVDAMGNVTIGIKEHAIFPECADEDLRDIFGLAITITTTAKDKAEATAFLEHLGVPFKKVDA